MPKNAEKCQKFFCEKCDFICCKKSNYITHLNTEKHKMVTNGNQKTPNHIDEIFSCICGNTYKYRPGLARHKKTCIAINNKIEK